MERMTIRDKDELLVKLRPEFRRGDYASQNVLHRLADLEDEKEMSTPSNVAFTANELEAIAFALEHLHDTDLSFVDTNIVKGLENAMDKLNIDYTSQLL